MLLLRRFKIKYKKYSGYFISLYQEHSEGHTLKMMDNETGAIVQLRWVNPKDIVWDNWEEDQNK